jgi:hypothetical protein
MIQSSFRFCGAVLAAIFLVTPVSARPQTNAPATTEGDFVVHNLKIPLRRIVAACAASLHNAGETSP